MDHRPGPQQHLRRRRAPRARLGHREHARDEPGPRGQRGALLRRGRARRALVRPARRPRGRRRELLAARSPTWAGAASSATPWSTGAATPRTATTPRTSAAWRSSCPTARSCAPAWAARPATRPGTSTSTPTARRSTACSCRATTGSSPRWASGSCPARRSTPPAARPGRARRRSRRWSTRCAPSCSRGSSATTPSWAAGSASAWTRSRSSTPQDPDVAAALRALRARGDRRRALGDRAGDAGAIPGVEVPASTDGRRRPPRQARGHDEQVQCGIPEMDLMDLFKTPYGEDTGHLDFSPVGPLNGKDVVETFRLVRALYDKPRLGVPRRPAHVAAQRHPRHDDVLRPATTRSRPARSTRPTTRWCSSSAKAGRSRTARTSTTWTSSADQLDFNDHVQRRMSERIKDALDPNGILSPGKQGIWPRTALGRRARPGPYFDDLAVGDVDRRRPAAHADRRPRGAAPGDPRRPAAAAASTRRSRAASSEPTPCPRTPASSATSRSASRPSFTPRVRARTSSTAGSLLHRLVVLGDTLRTTTGVVALRENTDGRAARHRPGGAAHHDRRPGGPPGPRLPALRDAAAARRRRGDRPRRRRRRGDAGRPRRRPPPRWRASTWARSGRAPVRPPLRRRGRRGRVGRRGRRRRLLAPELARLTLNVAIATTTPRPPAGPARLRRAHDRDRRVADHPRAPGARDDRRLGGVRPHGPRARGRHAAQHASPSPPPTRSRAAAGSWGCARSSGRRGPAARPRTSSTGG